METEDLLSVANDAIDSGVDHVILNIPEPEHHNGYRVRLLGSCGPLCYVISGINGRLNVRVEAKKLQEFSKRMIENNNQ